MTIFGKHEVTLFSWFCQYLLFLCSEFQQIFIFFCWGKLVDETLVFPCNIETNEVPSINISLVSVGTLNIFNKMWFQRIYVVKRKIFNFLKTYFSGIIFTCVDDFTLNNDNNKEIWSFGLCWPLLAFIGLFGLYGLGWFFKAKNGLCW